MENVIKKFLSLFISFLILFNLTTEVFATGPILPVNKEQKKELTNALNEVHSTTTSYNPAALERNYNNALAKLAEARDTYGDLEDAVNIAVQTEIVENGNWEILNNAILKQKTDLEKYNKVLQSYEDKIAKLGGIENIKKQYDLYQQWIALKPQMDQRKAELENIIKTGEDKSAGIRKITGFNKGEILYLKQPTATNYNQNAVNRFLSDIRDLRNNTKIGTEYYMYQP